MVLLHCEAFPQPSVAVQVLVILYSCEHKPGVVMSEKVIVTEASHASIAVMVPKDGVVPHSIGLTTTGQLMTGAVLSCTTIVLLHCDAFPHSSVAVHVRVTLYSWGHAPGVVTSAYVTNTAGSHASVTVGVPKLSVVPHSTGLMTTGQEMTGAILSCTTIVRLHCDAFPQSSVAVHVRVTLNA